QDAFSGRLQTVSDSQAGEPGAAPWLPSRYPSNGPHPSGSEQDARMQEEKSYRQNHLKQRLGGLCQENIVVLFLIFSIPFSTPNFGIIHINQSGFAYFDNERIA